MGIKIRIEEHDCKIYPRKLWVAFNASAKDLDSQFYVDDKVTFEEAFRACFGGATTRVRCRHTDHYGVIIFTSRSKFTVGQIAHESVHAADCIFEDLGMVPQDFVETNEPYAYLVGYIADCVEETMKNK